MSDDDTLRLFPPVGEDSKCALCKRRHHPGWGCPRWKKMTADERRAWLKSHGQV